MRVAVLVPADAGKDAQAHRVQVHSGGATDAERPDRNGFDDPCK